MDNNLMTIEEVVDDLVQNIKLCKKEFTKFKNRGKDDVARTWYQAMRIYEILLLKIGVDPYGIE